MPPFVFPIFELTWNPHKMINHNPCQLKLLTFCFSRFNRYDCKWGILSASIKCLCVGNVYPPFRLLPRNFEVMGRIGGNHEAFKVLSRICVLYCFKISRS